MSSAVHIDRVPMARWQAVLESFRCPSADLDRLAKVESLCTDASADGSQVMVHIANRGGLAVGLVLAKLQPGGSSIVWPPLLVDGEAATTASRLIEAAADEMRELGASLAQALLESETAAEVQPFLDAGFLRTSELLYLVCPDREFPTEPPTTELQFEPYRAADAPRLARLVERTYDQTLDCPELDGVRKTDDVLLGYRSLGVFDPARWLLVRHKDADVGCLLLTDHPDAGHWELVYLGLAPEYRGRGWGLEIVRHAQWLARLSNAPQLVLAVDAANAPAIACYAASGFAAWDRRGVYLKIFSRGDSTFGCQVPAS